MIYVQNITLIKRKYRMAETVNTSVIAPKAASQILISLSGTLEKLGQQIPIMIVSSQMSTVL